MRDGSASRVRVASRGGGKPRVLPTHPRLSGVLLVGMTFMLVAVLLATVQRALKASPSPVGWSFQAAD